MRRRKPKQAEPIPGRYSSHVVLRTDEDGSHQLIIDGMDVSNAVLTKGFRLYFDDNDGKMLPELQLDVTFSVSEIDGTIKAAVHKQDKAS